MRNIVRCSMVLLVCALGLGGCASPIVARERTAAVGEPWQAIDASTGQIADIDGLAALAGAFPNSSSVRLRLLNAHVAADNPAAALSIAEQLAAEGYAFSPGAREYLRGLLLPEGVPQWLAANDLNSAPIASSAVVATVPEEARLPEGLAVLDDGRFAVSTIISRNLWFGGNDDWEIMADSQGRQPQRNRGGR